MSEYRMTIRRSVDIWPWRWWWEACHEGWCHNGMTFTQRGAVRATRRAVRRFQRDDQRREQAITWTEQA